MPIQHRRGDVDTTKEVTEWGGTLCRPPLGMRFVGPNEDCRYEEWLCSTGKPRKFGGQWQRYGKDIAAEMT